MATAYVSEVLQCDTLVWQDKLISYTCWSTILGYFVSSKSMQGTLFQNKVYRILRNGTKNFFLPLCVHAYTHAYKHIHTYTNIQLNTYGCTPKYKIS